MGDFKKKLGKRVNARWRISISLQLPHRGTYVYTVPRNFGTRKNTKILNYIPECGEKYTTTTSRATGKCIFD